MRWPSPEQLASPLSLPADYRLERIQSSEIATVIALLTTWYPDIQVGAESCHLNPQFYDKNITEDLDNSGTIFVYLLKKSEEIVAFFSFEKEEAAQRLRNRLSAVSPSHRGKGLGKLAPQLLEICGKMMEAEIVYYVATLKTTVQQAIAEKAGFQLAGILPAYDRDKISNNCSKRVFEAIYIKVLVGAEEIFFPPHESLTPKTKALWNLLFGDELKN